MPEVIEDALFFHQPAREIEIGFTVLDAEIARLEITHDFKRRNDAFEDFFENVGHGYVLKNPAFPFAGKQPELRYDLGTVGGKLPVALSLAEAADDAIEESAFVLKGRQFNRDLLSQQLVERDIRIVWSDQF